MWVEDKYIPLLRSRRKIGPYFSSHELLLQPYKFIILSAPNPRFTPIELYQCTSNICRTIVKFNKTIKTVDELERYGELLEEFIHVEQSGLTYQIFENYGFNLNISGCRALYLHIDYINNRNYFEAYKFCIDLNDMKNVLHHYNNKKHK